MNPAERSAETAESSGRRRDWRLAAVVPALLAAWLLFSARQLLNPLVVALLLVFVLLPYRGAIWARRLLIVSVAIALLWLIQRLGSALAPFVIALVMAYFLDPLVDRLEARGITRSLAILLLGIPALGVIILVGLLVLPPLGREIANFVRQLPALVNTAADFIEPHLSRFSTLDVEQLVSTHLPSMLDPLNAVVSKITSGAVGVGKGFSFGVRLISFMIVTPLATFYALRDIDRFKAAVRELIPAHGRTLEVLAEIDALLGRYLRGQLIVSSILTVATWIGLAILGIPYALVLGLLTGFFNIVPIVGFWLSFLPVLLVALTMPDPVLSMIKVSVFYFLVQILEGNVLSPRIVGDEVGLNPVLMILAIVVFSSLFGMLGVIVAVPATAILVLFYRRWRTAARTTITADSA